MTMLDAAAFAGDSFCEKGKQECKIRVPDQL